MRVVDFRRRPRSAGLDSFHGAVCWVALYRNVFGQVADEVPLEDYARFQKVRMYDQSERVRTHGVGRE